MALLNDVIRHGARGEVVTTDHAPNLPYKAKSTSERLLAYGVLTVIVVENLEVAGYTPDRFSVAVGGQPVRVNACGFDVPTGVRQIDTELGLIVVPSAAQRAKGAPLTINGMPVPGA